jgi:histidinol-phosphate aminotransferase
MIKYISDNSETHMKTTSPLKLDPVVASKQTLLDLSPYIPGRPINEIKNRYNLEKVIKLASNECSLPMPDGIRRAIAEAVSKVGRYPDGHAKELRRALADYLEISTDAIMVGNGAEECLNMIGQAFLNPGDESIIPDPSFDAYRITTEFMDAKPVYVPSGNISSRRPRPMPVIIWIPMRGS